MIENQINEKNSHNKRRKKTNHDFHLENLKDIHLIGQKLEKIFQPINPPSLPLHYYERLPGRGFWMVIKEIVILRYITIYLKIQRITQPETKLFYIDLLSSSGMNKLSDESGKVFIIAGSSILAVWQHSFNNRNFFDKMYFNTWNSRHRHDLKLRINEINKFCNQNGVFNQINYWIDESNDNIDSNKIIDKIIEDMKNYQGRLHYLAVIDNEKLDIPFETIKKLTEWKDGYRSGNYGDLIINYPNCGINRSQHKPKAINDFFGKNMSIIPPDKWMETYIEQLKSIGFDHVEPLIVQAGDIPFFYTLLFCVRKDSTADWLDMIRKYANERFKNFTAEDVKTFKNILWGNQKTFSYLIKKKPMNSN